MRAFQGKDRKGGTVSFPDLRAHAAEAPLEIRAYPKSRGELATGITFTSVGGVTLTTGVVLTAVGCGDSAASCRGGIITALVGAAVTAGAIWLILDSTPRADITPRAQPQESGTSSGETERAGVPSSTWGPISLSGTF